MYGKFTLGNLYYRCAFGVRNEEGPWPMVDTWVFRGIVPKQGNSRDRESSYYQFCIFRSGENQPDGECVLYTSLEAAEIVYLTWDELLVAVHDVNEQLHEQDD
jgi:hypothetical protein